MGAQKQSYEAMAYKGKEIATGLQAKHGGSASTPTEGYQDTSSASSTQSNLPNGAWTKRRSVLGSDTGAI